MALDFYLQSPDYLPHVLDISHLCNYICISQILFFGLKQNIFKAFKSNDFNLISYGVFYRDNSMEGLKDPQPGTGLNIVLLL